MFEVSTESHFSSAHRLRGYKGKCENLHGHNWKVRITVLKAKLDNSGLVIDFHDLKPALEKVLKVLDHKYINKVAYFKNINPTSENLAKYIYLQLKKNKFCKNIDSLKVTVWESDKNYASYYE